MGDGVHLQGRKIQQYTKRKAEETTIGQFSIAVADATVDLSR